jgi:hypothetical protein
VTEAAPAMTDPVSWLQIGQGWNVITSDGVIVGTVAQVEGDKQSDIFDGLAVESKHPTQVRYVPGEQVGAIYSGEVTEDRVRGPRCARAVSSAASRDEVASGEAASHDSDVQLATGKTLEDLRRVASASGYPCLRPEAVLRSRHGPETRSRGAAADRGGRRLVRVPRGDAGSDGAALPRGRAVGVGATQPAAARRPREARKAPPGRRGRLGAALGCRRQDVRASPARSFCRAGPTRWSRPRRRRVGDDARRC